MESETATQSMPRIEDKAPAFKAVTTQGDIAFPDQYAGSKIDKVAVLDAIVKGPW